MLAVHSNIRTYGDDFDRIAMRLGIEAAALHAIAAAEVGSLAPPPNAAPVIRFEVHSILRMVEKNAPGNFAALAEVIQLRDAPQPWHADAHWYKSDPDDDWQRVHSGSQGDEHAAMINAGQIDPDSALKCTSWGVGQLMGWHYGDLGYERVQEMVSDAYLGEAEQFNQWRKFFENHKDGALLPLMRKKNWRGFAKIYNGPGQVDYYGKALQKHYNRAIDAIADGMREEHYETVKLDSWKDRQTSLAMLGYNPGKIDGDFGPTTRKALKAFQRDYGLTPDGIWGARTEKAMAEALA